MTWKIWYAAALGAALWTSCQQQPYKEGERLYKVYCANCHGLAGEGLGTLIPPLAQVDYLGAHRAELPCQVSVGVKDSLMVNGTLYVGQEMPAAPSLTDVQITNVLNFVNHAWGNNQPDFSLEEVRTLLKRCAK